MSPLIKVCVNIEAKKNRFLLNIFSVHSVGSMVLVVVGRSLRICAQKTADNPREEAQRAGENPGQAGPERDPEKGRRN